VDDYYATLLYQHKDQLTTRLATDNSGVLASYQGHFPFGEGWYEGGTADPSLQQRFATFMKDYETDSAQLHYAMSEFYSARNGQFQTLAPGRPGVTQPVNPYANQDPVNPPDPSNPNPNTPQFAVMTDGGGPLGNGCMAGDECGPGFGFLPLLGSSNMFAMYTNALQSYVNSIQLDSNSKPLDLWTPDDFTAAANAIMAFEDPSSFLNNIAYLPTEGPDGVWIRYYSNISDEEKKQLIANALKALDALWQNFLKWETDVFQKPPQGPVNPASPTSSTATCNLQTQAGTNCAYRCAGNRLFGDFSSTVAAIASACQLSNTGQCPAQIVIKGLDVSTAKVAACTIF
jgi:hypothetical protein